MAQDENNKEDQFDFTREGEALGYISLDQAVLQARTQVRQDEARYLERLDWDEIVWAELDSEQREDSYRVVLQFRRPARGLREEQTGEEEFLFDLAGILLDRQVLLWPEGFGAIERGSNTSEVPEPLVPTSQAEEPPLVADSPSSSPGNLSSAGLESQQSDSIEEEWTGDTRVHASARDTEDHLQCPQCKAEYRPGQEFCSTCGSRIFSAGVSPVSTRSVPTVDIAPVNRCVSEFSISEDGPSRTKKNVRKIASILLGLWGALLLLIGAIAAIPDDGNLVGILVIAGGVATLFGAVPTWPQTKYHFGSLSGRWAIVRNGGCRIRPVGCGCKSK